MKEPCWTMRKAVCCGLGVLLSRLSTTKETTAMHVITLIVGIVAAVVFGVDYSRSKVLVSLGLCLLTVTVILAFLLGGDDLIYLTE